MQRRKTTIGRGALGRTVSTDEHAAETLGRILSRGRPLTEDAVFLCMRHILRRNNASRIFQKVRASKDVGGYNYFSFSLPTSTCWRCGITEQSSGTNLRDIAESKREVKPPSPYEGIDQALPRVVVDDASRHPAQEEKAET